MALLCLGRWPDQGDLADVAAGDGCITGIASCESGPLLVILARCHNARANIPETVHHLRRSHLQPGWVQDLNSRSPSFSVTLSTIEDLNLR